MEFFRPYSMIVHLPDATASGINLVDSSGVALRSNYISIEASGVGDAYYRAAIDCGTASAVGDTGVATAANSIGVVTSAIPSQYAPITKGVCEFILSDADRSSLVTLQTSEADPTTFMITYGYIQFPGNSIRAQERSIGDKRA